MQKQQCSPVLTKAMPFDLDCINVWVRCAVTALIALFVEAWNPSSWYSIPLLTSTDLGLGSRSRRRLHRRLGSAMRLSVLYSPSEVAFNGTKNAIVPLTLTAIFIFCLGMVSNTDTIPAPLLSASAHNDADSLLGPVLADSAVGGQRDQPSILAD